jgi:cyanate permease
LVAICFAVYSLQWVAVLGFLPSIYAQSGVSQGAAGWMTALVAAANVSGNLAAGLLAKKGMSPPKVLTLGYLVMMLGAIGAFALPDASPLALRYSAIVMFSAVGGVIPGTLFALAVRLAPSEATVVTTVGWMHQCSALGQFSGPPLLAWVVAQTGSWQWTWVVTSSAAMVGVALSQGIRLRLALQKRLQGR